MTSETKPSKILEPLHSVKNEVTTKCWNGINFSNIDIQYTGLYLMVRVYEITCCLMHTLW